MWHRYSFSLFSTARFGDHPPAAMEPLFMAPWVRLPGWVDLPMLILALAALLRSGRPQKQPRLVLVLWMILWEARYYAFPPAVWLLTRIPGPWQCGFHPLQRPDDGFLRLSARCLRGE